MSSDLSFITNEPGKILRDRFGVLPGGETSALERELDDLVYRLYGLTKEERALLEDSARAK